MPASSDNPLADLDNRYEKLFNLSLDLLCIANFEGVFLDINPAFLRILGYPRDAILSQTFLDFIHPDDAASTLDELERLKTGGHTINFENRYRHKNGHYHILSWTAYADLEDNIIYANARDITEEKQHERKLSQMMDALNSQTILAMTDTQGVITEVNDNFCEISGYSREELIGQTHRIINSGQHPKSFFQDLWKTISSGKAWSGMIENRRKDGDHYFVQSVITPIFDIHGKIASYLAIRFDTTKHIKVKRELSKTLAILNETGAIAKVGGWELDIATEKLTWTDETFRILEVEKRDDQCPVLAQGLKLFTPEYQPVIEKAVQRAIEFGEPYSLELEAQTAKGNVRWVYTNGKANYRDGKIVSLSGTIQDIHDKKLTEKKYKIERMKNIQSAKLASLGEMSAGIAHEINNPLSIIYGTAQLLPKHFHNPEKLQTKTDEIIKSCQRITRIVSSLRKFSRSSEKSQHEQHYLEDIIRESIVLTSTKAKRHQTLITFEHSTKGSIKCDEVEIEQVIINLVNNGIDAVLNSQERWVNISLSEDNHHIILAVTDSGDGIPKEIANKIFDPFFTTKPTGLGTGLGLSVTKGILDEHYADIHIDNANSNTRFVIYFPKYLGEIKK